ncbi:MAG: chemotaxis protein CheW [Gammaproteobacteria bacterium]
MNNSSDMATASANAASDNAGDVTQYLSFFLADEEYGVSILSVQEIKGAQKVTPIPNAPEHVLGVINLRGTVVPIMDLRRRFHMTPASFDANTVFIVVHVHEGEHSRTVGVVVDAVSQVYDVPHAAINPPPEVGGALNAEFIDGLVTMDEKMVILLDISKLINVGMLGDELAPQHAPLAGAA